MHDEETFPFGIKTFDHVILNFDIVLKKLNSGLHLLNQMF